MANSLTFRPRFQAIKINVKIILDSTIFPWYAIPRCPNDSNSKFDACKHNLCLWIRNLRPLASLPDFWLSNRAGMNDMTDNITQCGKVKNSVKSKSLHYLHISRNVFRIAKLQCENCGNLLSPHAFLAKISWKQPVFTKLNKSLRVDFTIFLLECIEFSFFYTVHSGLHSTYKGIL